MTTLLLDSLIKLYPKDARNARYRSTACIYNGFLKWHSVLKKEAVMDFDTALSISYRFNRMEIRMGVFSLLSDLYRAEGNADLYRKTQIRSILLKDSIWNTKITKGLQQLRFNDEKEDIKRQLLLMEYKQKVLTWVIVTSIGVIVCFSIFMYFIVTRVRDNDIQLGDITVRHELSGGQSLIA